MKKLMMVLFLTGMIEAYAQNYDQIDQRIQSLPKKEYVSLEALYKDIVLPDYSEAEKVRAIAMWIVYNIAYDVTYTHSKTPLETLKRRMWVCQSYAEFFKALCDMAAVECHLILGHGRNYASLIGMPVRTNHAWNAVKLGQKFHLFDLTWAAGYVNDNVYTQRYNSHYYMTPPEWFVLDHFPDDPKWQLSHKPVPDAEYINNPYFEKAFFYLGIRNLHPSTGIIFSDTIKIKFQSDQEIYEAMVFRFRFNDYRSVEGEDLTIKKNGKDYEISYVERNPGAYKYSIHLNGLLAFYYKVATPNYTPEPPTAWDLTNPHSLIEAYHHIFHAFDQKLFAKLNPASEIKDLNTIPLAGDLNKSLANWYGDYEKFYVQGPGDIVTIQIEGFALVLQKDAVGWVFKEIKREG